MRPSLRRAVLLATAVAVAAPLGPVAAPASAGTFPGRNGLITFASDRAGAGHDIWTMRPDGTHQRMLVNTPGDDASIFTDWSPNARRLAFDTNRFGPEPDVMVRFPNGSTRRLTTYPGRDAYPTFAPDGERIMFESDRGGSRQAWIIRVDGTGLRRLTNLSEGVEEPSFSPTGEWIAFLSGPARRTAIFVVRPDGTGLRRLTPRWLNGGNPSWAPDGRTIVFGSNIEKPGSSIWTVTLGGQVRRLTTPPGDTVDFDPTYSPDGRFIAFSSTRRTGDDADIWVMRSDGTALRNLTPSPGFEVGVSWQPI